MCVGNLFCSFSPSPTIKEVAGKKEKERSEGEVKKARKQGDGLERRKEKDIGLDIQNENGGNNLSIVQSYPT
jgi:hypothetical protein